MEFAEFKADLGDSGRRLTLVVRRIFEKRGMDCGSLFPLLRKGLVRLNGRSAPHNAKVKEGDVIFVAEFLLKQHGIHSERRVDGFPSLKIAFSNEHILTIDKPSGMRVQPSKGGGITLSQIVEEIWNDESKRKEVFGVEFSTALSFKPGPLHRLDRFTSGLICFSLSVEGARWFSAAMKARKIGKRYLALVQGKFTDEEFGKVLEYSDFILPMRNSMQGAFHTISISSMPTGESKKALLLVRPLFTTNFRGLDVTLVKVTLITGCKHQIRAQCAFHGHPLLGDTAYGGKGTFDFYFLLHAAGLEFPERNPLSLPAIIESPPPQKFCEVLGLSPESLSKCFVEGKIP